MDKILSFPSVSSVCSVVQNPSSGSCYLKLDLGRNFSSFAGSSVGAAHFQWGVGSAGVVWSLHTRVKGALSPPEPHAEFKIYHAMKNTPFTQPFAPSAQSKPSRASLSLLLAALSFLAALCTSSAAVVVNLLEDFPSFPDNTRVVATGGGTINTAGLSNTGTANLHATIYPPVRVTWYRESRVSG